MVRIIVGVKRADQKNSEPGVEAGVKGNVKKTLARNIWADLVEKS